VSPAGVGGSAGPHFVTPRGFRRLRHVSGIECVARLRRFAPRAVPDRNESDKVVLSRDGRVGEAARSGFESSACAERPQLEPSPSFDEPLDRIQSLDRLRTTRFGARPVRGNGSAHLFVLAHSDISQPLSACSADTGTVGGCSAPTQSRTSAQACTCTAEGRPCAQS
jgi:hypothetical protein